MLTISNLTYKIGARTIIDNANLTVMDRWKVGVVGLNGAGKSTLFKLIAGDMQPDGGSVQLSARDRLGMVRQDIPETDMPLIDVVMSADEELSSLMAEAETATDPYRIADIHVRLAEIDAYAAPSRAALLLTGLGFRDNQLHEPFSSFSGGWRMRVALAAALFVQPEILLLDEPTNHLDLEAIMWLESYLQTYPHTLMIISHDRDLLNKCATHIVHVDKQDLTLYTGNYDTYERERAMKLGLQQKMHEKQMAQRAHMQKFIDRFKAKASKARQAQSRMKALERMDVVDAVIAERAIQFTFPQPEELAPPLIAIKEADVGYHEDRPVLRRVRENIDMDDRIALLGANGNGKSTLIKLIAGKLGAMKGEVVRSGKLRIGYFSQYQTDELNVDSTPYEEMAKLMRDKLGSVKESAVRAKLGHFGFGKELADNRIGALSGGEKARLLFAIMSFDAPHILLLDEPTNHLDMDAREALVRALNEYEGAVVMVSHDPSIVERVADRLWLVKDGACEPFDGDLDDYRQFIIRARREQKREEREERAAERSARPAAGEKAGIPAAQSAKGVPNAVRRKIQQAEKAMERLAAEKAGIEALMADPAFYQDAAKVRETNAQYARISSDLETAEAAWLEAQEDI